MMRRALVCLSRQTPVHTEPKIGVQIASHKRLDATEKGARVIQKEGNKFVVSPNKTANPMVTHTGKFV